MRQRHPKVTDSFYKSKRWRTVRRFALERDLYQCVVCGADVSAPGAARVDHVKERSTHPELELDIDNLRTLCVLHDQQSHREKGGTPDAPRTERVERFAFKGVDRDGWPVRPGTGGGSAVPRPKTSRGGPSFA